MSNKNNFQFLKLVVINVLLISVTVLALVYFRMGGAWFNFIPINYWFLALQITVAGSVLASYLTFPVARE